MMNYWDALSAIKNKIEMIKAEKANNRYLYEDSKFKYLCFTKGVEYSFDELLESGNDLLCHGRNGFGIKSFPACGVPNRFSQH